MVRRIREWLRSDVVCQVVPCTAAGLLFGFFSGHLWGLSTVGVWTLTAFLLGTAYGLIAMIHVAARRPRPNPHRARRASGG